MGGRGRERGDGREGIGERGRERGDGWEGVCEKESGCEREWV